MGSLTNLINLAISFGFWVVIPSSGIFVGIWGMRTSKLWFFNLVCFGFAVLAMHVAWLGQPLFYIACVTIWFAIVTDVTKGISKLIRLITRKLQTPQDTGGADVNGTIGEGENSSPV